MRRHYGGVFLLACFLSACGSAPARFDPDKNPYWLDLHWEALLLITVQAAVHAPDDTGDRSTPGYHGSVKFTFLDGNIEYPEIVTSTGNPELDKLMLHQVVSVQVPKPTGLHANEPHEFLLDLDMPTAFESFQNSIYAAIDHRKIYPKEAILTGSTGSTTVDFDYQDGKAANIVMAASSKNKDLDKASLGAVSNASYPSAPPAYAGKTLRMEAIVCYSINNSKNCPADKNVILVQATRRMY